MNNREDNLNLRLGRRNLYFVAAGLLVVVIGLVLMAWGPNSDLHTFESDIFSVRRTVIAPVVIFAGFISIMVAIWVNPSSEDENESTAVQKLDKTVKRK